MDELEQEVVFQERQNETRQSLQAQLKEYKEKMIPCSEGIKTLYLDKVKGILTEEDFIQLSADLHKDRNTYEKRIAEVSAQLEELEKSASQFIDRRTQLEQYVTLEHLTHEVVNQLIDSIIIGKRNPETKEIPIEINWKF